jgi:hypothetical protein
MWVWMSNATMRGARLAAVFFFAAAFFFAATFFRAGFLFAAAVTLLRTDVFWAEAVLPVLLFALRAAVMT